MTHDELREWLEAVQVARRETGDYEFFNVWAYRGMVDVVMALGS